MPESAGLCAIVTDKGNLLMANLAERKLVSGPNGPVLRSQVSCAAWSTKGKQLVAGMADGTIYQMTPEGVEKAHIPKPPNLGDYHGEFPDPHFSCIIAFCADLQQWLLFLGWRTMFSLLYTTRRMAKILLSST